MGISPQELLGFDSNIIFNNSTSHQKGEFIAYNNTAVKQVQALYERLLAAKDEQLEHMRNQLNVIPRKSQ